MASYKDSSWYIWELTENSFYDASDFEIKKMKMTGFRDSLIYFQWKEHDVGSGMGSIFMSSLCGAIEVNNAT